MYLHFASEVLSPLVAQALCALLASFCATALFAAVAVDRFPGFNFKKRFLFLLCRYTVPLGIVSLFFYWLLFRQQ
jgi:hypothetical protein